ncbi:ead/Ea22-like family protein [Citrobacter sp. Cb130]|uniref:ead/Ea22-like family protein n=1 Tax=Citrobacter sp. Cb130 TaxID=2985033 RepID=UPI002576C01B|nr:ead/Ea22-like family protein [Citrobacter sp. Cb130]MDM3328857.1 ead/Ea22-like family protein [Citrobacter sp. Cb130]
MKALNKQALRSKARSASAGKWIKESGDGWEAICSSDDQANGNFIIAHFEGPDAEANREFVQVANPDTVLALLDELEARDKHIAELEKSRKSWTELAGDIEQMRKQWADIAIEMGRLADEKDKRIAELSASHSKLRDTMAGIHNTIRMDGGYTPLAAILNAAKRAYEESATAAGIGVKGE